MLSRLLKFLMQLSCPKLVGHTKQKEFLTVVTSPLAHRYRQWQEHWSESGQTKAALYGYDLAPQAEQEYQATSEVPENVINKARVRAVIES